MFSNQATKIQLLLKTCNITFVFLNYCEEKSVGMGGDFVEKYYLCTLDKPTIILEN